MKNPFKTALIRSLIEEAIVRSERTYRHLESEFARAVKEETAELLKNLMAAQLLHRMRLQEVQRKGEPDRNGFKEKISGFTDRTPAPLRAGPDPWSSPDAILHSAIVNETHTHQAYKRLSENALLGSVRDLFAYLAHEELQHIQWLESLQSGKNP